MVHTDLTITTTTKKKHTYRYILYIFIYKISFFYIIIPHVKQLTKLKSILQSLLKVFKTRMQAVPEVAIKKINSVVHEVS